MGAGWPTTAANHFEQVPRKIPLRYSCSVGARNAVADSLFYPLSSAIAFHVDTDTLSGSLMPTFSKEKSYSMFYICFLQMYQSGEGKSDTHV